MTLWTDALGAQIRYVQAGPWRTRVLEAGEGERHVVLLSGITGHVEGWTRNIRALAEQGLHVWAIDLIGHGFSDKPLDVDYVAPTFAQHVVHFLDAIGAEKADLVGQSLGGWVALYVAKTYPERVNRLVHVTGAGILLDDEARAQEAANVGANVANATTKALAETTPETVRTRLEWLVLKPETVTDELVDVRYRIYTLPDSRAAMPKLVEQAPGAAGRPFMLTEADLAALPHETLIVWSDHNPTTPWEVGKRASEILPNASFAMITEAGHWPMFEQPEQFNAIVASWLGR
jgi:2-hydroxy-6-oxonona-2,4-dienedioate hydrolase/2-hydroxy-6-oxo-6-(2'-carboxyphenyl)-hexa-2,4-dienoate hydrolase